MKLILLYYSGHGPFSHLFEDVVKKLNKDLLEEDFKRKAGLNKVHVSYRLDFFGQKQNQ